MKTLRMVAVWIVAFMCAAVLNSQKLDAGKVYSPDHGDYVCRVGEAVNILLPTEYYSIDYQNQNWEVDRLYHCVWACPRKAHDRLTLRVIDREGREIIFNIRSLERNAERKSDCLVTVDRFPGQERLVDREIGLITERKLKTEGELELSGVYEKGKESRFALTGSAALAGKTGSGLFFQGAGKVDISEQVKEYGFSAGAGYEPGNIGYFLFLDGLVYKVEGYDSTFHVQVRPAVRFKQQRFMASAFLAVPVNKDRYTGVDVTEEGIEYSIFNRALFHVGLKLDALVSSRLLVSLKTLIACGKVFKIDVRSSYKLFPKVFVNVGCQYSSFGKYPVLSGAGFGNLTRISAGVCVGLGKVEKFKDLRQRIIYEPDYPLVSQVKKRKEAEKQAPFTAALTARPTSGSAPLAVQFELVVQGGKPPFHLAWHLEPGYTDHNNSTRLSHTYTQPGKYNVTVDVEDSQGQQTTSNTVTIEVLETDTAKKSYTITSSGGKNGTIEPLGEVTVNQGDDRVFNMKPDAGFVVADVRVDEKSKGALSSYTFENVRQNHTIHAEFESAGVNTYTIRATGSSGGAISPEGEVTVVENHDATFRMTPEYGYRIKQVKVDGQAVKGTPQSYTFEQVTEDHTIHVDFERVTFTIESSADENGSIDPLGTHSFLYGESRKYTIKPDSGYMIADVRVDGKSVGAVSEYLFSHIDGNHRIHAAFTDIPITMYRISATSGSGGSISPSGTVQVQEGGSALFTLSPEPGWKIKQLKVDGQVNQVRNNQYEFSNIQSDHTIHVDYERITHQITASSTTGGLIDPAGTTTVFEGDDRTYTITPQEGYRLSRLLVDNIDTALTTAYTFTNVTASHTIRAEFQRITHVIEASAETGGSIDPVGSIKVFELDDQTFHIAANPGYKIKDVKVNSQSMGAVSTYTFEKVKSSATIRAEFERLRYEITAAAGSNGSITPSGTVKVYWGENQRFDFTPNTGYRVADVIVNGSSLGARSAYTFENVKSSQTIRVEFEIITFTIEASSGANGKIRPVGSVVVEYGSSKTFTMSPDDPAVYEIDRVMVDSQNKGALLQYTFTHITADHTIRALWKKKKYKIVSTVGSTGGGTIKPLGTQYYDALATPTYTITANTGYRIDRVVVDGVNKGPLSTFTFAPLKSDHTITVYFKRITFTVTITKAFTDGTLGSPPNPVTPLGTLTVYYGDDLDITIQNHWSLSTGGEFYSLDYVLDNGTDTVYRGTPKDLLTHTIPNIKENHTITIYFYHRIRDLNFLL